MLTFTVSSSAVCVEKHSQRYWYSVYNLKSLAVYSVLLFFLLICFGGSVSGPKGEMACSWMTNCFFSVTVDGWNQCVRVGREYSWAAAHEDSVDRMCYSILKVSQVSSSQGFQSTPSFCARVFFVFLHTFEWSEITELACLLSFLWLGGCEGELAADCCLCCAHSTCIHLFCTTVTDTESIGICHVSVCIGRKLHCNTRDVCITLHPCTMNHG